MSLFRTNFIQRKDMGNEYFCGDIIRLLQCSKCLSSENKKIVYRTRDANSAINIKNLFKFYCKNKKRPKEFIRSSSVQVQSKVEQSVDFTGDKAPNLCTKTD